MPYLTPAWYPGYAEINEYAVSKQITARRRLSERDNSEKTMFAKCLVSCLSVAAALAIALPTEAGLHPRGPNDYLHPETSAIVDPNYSEYEVAVARLLFNGQDSYRRVQMMVLPSFNKPELAVFVETVPPERGTCSSDVGVVVAQARENVGQVGMRRGPPQNHSCPYPLSPWDGLTIATDVTRATIDCATAQLLEDLWQEMLRTLRYPTQMPGMGMQVHLDATVYHFADFEQGIGWRSGITESPEPRTALGRLVAVGFSLVAYVKAPEAERKGRLAGLVSQAKALLSDIR
jgi:hypothetical protein